MSRLHPVSADPAEDHPPLTAKIELRVTPEVKAAAMSKAQSKETTISDVLRRALERWVEA